jgi:hypothetical protein
MITKEMLNEFLNETNWSAEELLLEVINDAFNTSEILNESIPTNLKRGNLAEDIILGNPKLEKKFGLENL